MTLSSADFFFFYFNIKFQGKESFLPRMPLTFANSIMLCTYFGSSLILLFCMAYPTCLLLGLTTENPVSPSVTMAYPVALP